jgi:hypothetical protein
MTNPWLKVQQKLQALNISCMSPKMSRLLKQYLHQVMKFLLKERTKNKATFIKRRKKRIKMDLIKNSQVKVHPI